MKTLSRRALLRGAAGAAVALPFLSAMMPSRRARAQASDLPAPKRIVFILTPNGFFNARWKVNIGSATESRTYTPSPILSRFPEDIRAKSIFMEGIALHSAIDGVRRRLTCAVGHPGGTTSVFTGAYAGPGDQRGGNTVCKAGPPESPSVDYIISRALATRPESRTRFDAIRTGVHLRQNTISKRVFYGPNQSILTPEPSPVNLFDTIFSGVSSGGNPEADRALRRRTRILDAVADRYRALRCELGAEDRQRLDLHMTEVESLSQRLQATPPSGATCQVPARPSPNLPITFPQLPTLTPLMFDLVAHALACDLTRVIGFQMHASDMDGEGIYSWLGQNRIFHEISHREGPSWEQWYQAVHQWQVDQITYFVRKLQSIPEGSGTVFDNTVIVWTSEIGEGYRHNYDDHLFGIIGSGQGYFDVGKYVRFGDLSEPDRRHNRLLLHFAQYMDAAPSNGIGPVDYRTTNALPRLTS